MKRENIKQAGFIIDEIQKIESEIIQLNKIAQLINSNSTKINFKISVEDLDEKENVIDEDGSLKHTALIGFHSMFEQYHLKEEQSKNTHDLTQSITDVETYEILGLLLLIKKNKKDALQTILEKL